jgi:NADPH:quinone reductase-like Zn-dependent oxidoreductase
VAKALGARVMGTSGSPEKLQRLTTMGLDVALHTRGPDFVDAVMKATEGHGADLAVNTVGGTMFAACVEALGFEGRMATVGYVDGVVHADIDIAALHKKRLQLFGVSNKLRTPAQRITATQHFARDLLPWFADGRLVPVVDGVYSFDRLAEAQQAMDANTHLGKLVVRMD